MINHMHLPWQPVPVFKPSPVKPAEHKQVNELADSWHVAVETHGSAEHPAATKSNNFNDVLASDMCKSDHKML